MKLRTITMLEKDDEVDRQDLQNEKVWIERRFEELASLDRRNVNEEDEYNMLKNIISSWKK